MEEKTKSENIENNTLSIIDYSNQNSKDKIISNNNINNNANENIPIKQQKNIILNNAEDFYLQLYPEYKLYKFCGILFCKMGNLITFNFNKKNNFSPKYSIGPHWFLTLFLNCLIITLGGTLYIFIIRRLKQLFKIVFFIFYFILIFFLDRAALIHPGIEMEKEPTQNKYKFCNICKIYYNPDDKVSHCSMCQVCITKMDHHCVWIGKCVGKNNICAFFEMIIAVSFFYIYIIFCVIIYNMKYD